MSRDRSGEERSNDCGGCGGRCPRASRSIVKRRMSDKAFFDTNVLVYAVGQHDARTPTAEALARAGGLISVQVLNELASVGASQTADVLAGGDDALGAIRILCPSPIPITARRMTPPCDWRKSTATTSTTRSSSPRRSRQSAHAVFRGPAVRPDDRASTHDSKSIREPNLNRVDRRRARTVAFTRRRGERSGGTPQRLAAKPGACGRMVILENADRRKRMARYVLDFQEIDQTQVAIVGGKGAHLGELSRIEGIRVPAGFCVTTDAFQRIMAEAPSIDDRLDRLSRLKPDDRDAIRALSAEIRRTIEAIAIPDDLAAAITRALARLGEQAAYAVRSSATAEDLPTASFAGQQDTYLNVVGPAAILEHVSRCWASLFTERAVTYRLRNGFDHRKVHMAVVVQQMVFPQASGILFTADPVTGNRKVASVEASFGLGEALVSGLVNADVYKVRDGEIVAKTIAAKQLAIDASPAGGTQEQAIEPERQEQPALTDAQVVRLAQLGRRIEAHFGRPQDIEWCLVDDDFQIVQSRPITTLFPIPAAGDQENHVYISVGHQQMMTDPMKPLGLSVLADDDPRPMAEAGGRLFVDVTRSWLRRRAARASSRWRGGPIR